MIREFFDMILKWLRKYSFIRMKTAMFAFLGGVFIYNIDITIHFDPPSIEVKDGDISLWVQITMILFSLLVLLVDYKFARNLSRDRVRLRAIDAIEKLPKDDPMRKELLKLLGETP